MWDWIQIIFIFTPVVKWSVSSRLVGLISHNTTVVTMSFVAPSHASCSWVSVWWVIYGHANVAVCLGRQVVFARWALVGDDWGPRGGESVPNCWHRHKAGRDIQREMGRWPSQVLTLTDEIKEKVGHARQVSGKQTPGDRVRDQHSPSTNRAWRMQKQPSRARLFWCLSSICLKLFVLRVMGLSLGPC